MRLKLKEYIALVFLLVLMCLAVSCGSNENEVTSASKNMDSTSVSTTLTTSVITTTTATTTTATTSTTAAATITTTTTLATTTTTVTATLPVTTTTQIYDASYAPYAGLYDAQNLQAIYEESAGERIYPASLTKLVTALTALKYVSSDTVFTVGTELFLVKSGSSICMISQGNRLTLYDLMTGMLIKSGNDAAYTIAVNVARIAACDETMSDEAAVEYFVSLMNQTAAEIGAVNTHFENPEGWDDENQYTTIQDLALIASCAIKIEEIKEIVSTPSRYVVFESGENITWNNTNALLHTYSPYYCEQAIGMKTGTTQMAGKCLIAVFDFDEKRYIAISAGSQTEEQRYTSVLKMLEMIN